MGGLLLPAVAARGSPSQFCSLWLSLASLANPWGLLCPIRFLRGDAIPGLAPLLGCFAPTRDLLDSGDGRKIWGRLHCLVCWFCAPELVWAVRYQISPSPLDRVNCPEFSSYLRSMPQNHALNSGQCSLNIEVFSHLTKLFGTVDEQVFGFPGGRRELQLSLEASDL